MENKNKKRAYESYERRSQKIMLGQEVKLVNKAKNDSREKRCDIKSYRKDKN